MLRKFFSLALFFLLLLLFSGCKRVKHEVVTFYKVDIPTQEIALKTDRYLFGGSAVLDPSLNEETSTYWEIVAVDLGDVTLGISEASITDWLFSYQLQITVTNNTTEKSVSYLIEGMNSLHPDNSFLIPDTSENRSFFTEILKNRDTATVEVTGYSSQPDIIIIFNFSINARVGLG